MIAALTNHLWQSTLFVMAAGLLTLALRRNRASVRHTVWLMASLKFLVPFSVLMSVGPLIWTPRATAAPPAVATDVSTAIMEFSQPFGGAAPIEPAVAPGTSAARYIVPAAIVLYACGCAALVAIRLRGWRQIRSAVRASAPAAIAVPGLVVRAAPWPLEPGVVGLWRPILLVPAGIESSLTPAQMQAVLAHELHHVTRRDNLTSAIHMVVETAFWFHPLVWWISARLVDERERACDEHVVRVCAEPQAYAEGIVNVCKLYVESPLACVSGVSGFVSPRLFGGGGSILKRRLQAILAGAVARELGVVKKAGLTLAAVGTLAIPIGIGAMTADSIRIGPVTTQTGGFEVVSIKPCATPPPDLGARAGGAGQGKPSPGRVHLECVPLLGNGSLIRTAYGNYADGRLNAYWTSLRVEGAPAWASTERYTIEAKADGPVPTELMRGPMMQKVLAERFHLQVHRETRDVPVYDLTAPVGASKLKPFDGKCKPVDFTKGSLPDQLEAEGACAVLLHDTIVDAPGATLQDLIRFALVLMDRPVVDKTGLTGRFDIHLTLPKDDNTLPSDVTSRLALAVQQQLGLKLTPAKGPGEFLVIDHVERPVPDDQIQQSGPRSMNAPSGRGFGAPIALPARARNAGGR